MHDCLSKEEKITLYWQVLQLGSQVLEWLERYGREQINLNELITYLKNLGARAILIKYWNNLVKEPGLAPCLEVLQLLSSLEEEIDFQLSSYGFNSLYEDYVELKQALTRLGRKTTLEGSLERDSIEKA